MKKELQGLEEGAEMDIYLEFQEQHSKSIELEKASHDNIHGF